MCSNNTESKSYPVVFVQFAKPPPWCFYYCKKPPCQFGIRCVNLHDRGHGQIEETSVDSVVWAQLQMTSGTGCLKYCTYYLSMYEKRPHDLLLRHRYLEMNGARRCDSFAEADIVMLNNIPPSNVWNRMRNGAVLSCIPGAERICQKDKLTAGMKAAGMNAMPESFVLPFEVESFSRTTDSFGGLDPWILKPLRQGNGRGIEVTIGKEAVLARLNNDARPTIKGKQGAFLACRYIEKPLLLHGRKVDLRVYMLVTASHEGGVAAFLHEVGLLRMAGLLYADPRQCNDIHRHVTNDRVGKHINPSVREDYMSTDEFWTQLQQESHGYATVAKTKSTLRNIVGLLARYAAPHILSEMATSQAKWFRYFQLFGVDILIDESYRPWLLEVNGFPDLTFTTKNMKQINDVDFAVKNRVVHDMWNRVGIVCRGVNEDTGPCHHAAQQCGPGGTTENGFRRVFPS